VRVLGLEVVLASLSMREPVYSAGMTHADKTTLFVRLSTEEGSGWGECCAYPGARFPDPTIEDVEPVLVDRAVDRLFSASSDGSLPPADRVGALCRGGDGSVAGQAVAAALEMAVLDAELRSSGRSLASWLSVPIGVVVSGALVGIPPGRDLHALLDAVGAALEGGAARVRLKIEPGWDRRPLEAVRAHFPEADLQADANGSFTPDRTSELQALDDLGLACLEQPFGADDLDAHAVLANTMATPIGLDESLWSLARVERALAAGACRVACLKPGRLGGAVAALDAASACAAAGVGCFVGGFFESGLGRSLNATLAARPEFSLPGDLGNPDTYLVANPFAYLAFEGGRAVLSPAAGVGGGPREDLLAGARRRWLPFPR
jgi:o-succinylbenzoate synthase